MKKSSFLLASIALFALCLTSCEETNSPSAPIDGMLSGEFSVSASTKVHFSQGNLLYVGTWQFAKHQWDCFGSINSNHRDLFGWGTGNNPNESSTYVYDYSRYTEWGDNPITNGGNKANQWRTLTKDEWVYLFHGRKNAETLFGVGNIDGIKGTIILPDNWVLPQGASFSASITEGWYWAGDYYHNKYDDYSDNTYTKEQWSVMEKAGAVFLPAAGSGSVWQVSDFGWVGHYWSATPTNRDTEAYSLFFHQYYFQPQCKSYRSGIGSVRLVR